MNDHNESHDLAIEELRSVAMEERLVTQPGSVLPSVQRDSFDLTVEELRDLAHNVAYSCGSGVGTSGFWSSYWTGSCSCGCSCSCDCSCSCEW